MLDTGSSENERPRRRTAIVARELSRYAVDIAALSETRLSGEGSLREDGGGYTFFWRGRPEGLPRIHGVGLAVKNAIADNLTESPTYISERLLSLRIPLQRGEFTTVISAYAPTLASEEDIKDQFYESLHEVLSRVRRSDKLVLLGDFNARVGRNSEIWPGVIDRHGVGKMNSNGLRLLTLCAEHNLSISNTFFRIRNMYKASWMHPRSRHWHLIDYIIYRHRDIGSVSRTRAMRGAECSTDHRLIISDVCWRVRPKVRRQQSNTKKLNVAALQDSTKREEFQAKLHASFEPNRGTNIQSGNEIESFWRDFTETIREAAKETIGLKKRKHRDWFDENDTEIRTLLSEKNPAHNASLRNPSSVPLRNRFKELRAHVQRELRRIEDGWWVQLAEEIQSHADTNDMHNFYSSLKRAYGPTSRCMTPVRSADGVLLIKDAEGISKRWAQHYASLLNGSSTADISVLDEISQSPIAYTMDDKPTLEEVRKYVQTLKNNKSPGIDGVPAEIFKYGGDGVVVELHRLIEGIWDYELVPSDWRESLIISIYKNKGDKSVCGNSRGISLLVVAGKILAKILLARLIQHISESIMPETQCGFRQGRSTADMIFVSRQVLEKCREQHVDLHLGFVDLAKAFDTVDRDLLWAMLAKAGCPDKYIRVIKLLHDGMSARVRIDNLESDPFPVNRGVKQGCVLAPVLFNIYVQYVTRLLHLRLGDTGGAHVSYRMDRSLFDLKKLKARTKTHTIKLYEMQYADDCALLAHTPDELQEMITVAAQIYQRFGLKINAGKTEVLVWSSRIPSSFTFSIEEQPLSVVPSFKYLGSYLSNDCKLDVEVENRVSQASRAFGRLRERVFQNHNLSLPTKVKVYEAICLSVLLYGSEAWTLYARHVRTLEMWHMRCLRSILGITWRDKITHSEILRRTNSASMESITSKRQLRWLGHVIRMEDHRLPKQLLYGELIEGRRSAGGQKKRHKDHIKTILKKCDINPCNLESLAANRSEWRSVCYRGVENLEEQRHENMRRRRERRHQIANLPPPQQGDFTCQECGRVCRSRIGLHSHISAHQRQYAGGRDVIIGNDGPP